MDPHTFLYDVSSLFIDRFCEIMDTGCHRYGWRGLAARILPSFTEVRVYERMEAGGRSPTRELLWSWAQQNSQVRDLLKVLQDMGHFRAMQLFQDQCHAVQGTYLPLINECEPTELVSTANTKESIKFETSHRHESSGKPWPLISLQNIQEGTRDFHNEMRISEGCFSDIYLAHIEGVKFAVKLFKQVDNVSWKRLWDVFRKEVEIHRLCQHPNIIECLGCFSDERCYCLVYPYLPKGSLFHRLHRENSVPPLSWQERVNILKGVAKALHHLHTSEPSAVICGNLSSSNVLLDDSLQPKLSDFSLAQLRPHSVNRHHTITLDTNVYGNPGYLPVEYLRNGKLSAGLDVFSFGMVVMETVTGRKVVEELPKHMLLRDLLCSEAEKSGSVDSCLQFVDTSAGLWPTSWARSLLNLSLQCVASHRCRPSMDGVLQALSQLLPPPSCSSLDRPHSLDDGVPIQVQGTSLHSVAVEDDEQCGFSGSSATQARPCECSQSEVTYLRVTEAKGRDPPYKSWPVQCSCQAETGGLACEDCRANGFSSTCPQLAE
ncbi:interleukin-1 receptor-associated kinase 3 [Corythoichthys intestinalis]|uniref:interleukin-1 receptor-associated kinase 3 n=1 Tax=Corythoichthys intestinalis TaxID=161448 RepID=UPI0025A5F1E5|nr:interleukin-1 receptor-associated kinase 3 [Corythoichthys intestinalis]